MDIDGYFFDLKNRYTQTLGFQNCSFSILLDTDPVFLVLYKPFFEIE